MIAVLLAALAVAAQSAPALNHRAPSMEAKSALPGKSLCDAFGFDNDYACLFCSVEELLPVMHSDNPELIPLETLAASSSCLRVRIFLFAVWA